MAGLMGIFRKDPRICKGEITMRDGILRVECTECGGPSDLSEPPCFRGLSGKLPPGFSGEVILSGAVERGYSGTIVEALSSYSDIMGLARSLKEASGSRSNAVRKELNSLMDILEDDPSRFLENKGRIRKITKKDRELSGVAEELIERTSLMIRRLERSIDHRGSV